MSCIRLVRYGSVRLSRLTAVLFLLQTGRKSQVSRRDTKTLGFIRDGRGQKSSDGESKRSQCLHGTPGTGTCCEPAREPSSRYFLARRRYSNFRPRLLREFALAITAGNSAFKSVREICRLNGVIGIPMKLSSRQYHLFHKQIERLRIGKCMRKRKRTIYA